MRLNAHEARPCGVGHCCWWHCAAVAFGPLCATLFNRKTLAWHFETTTPARQQTAKSDWFKANSSTQIRRRPVALKQMGIDFFCSSFMAKTDWFWATQKTGRFWVTQESSCKRNDKANLRGSSTWHPMSKKLPKNCHCPWQQMAKHFVNSMNSQGSSCSLEHMEHCHIASSVMVLTPACLSKTKQQCVKSKRQKSTLHCKKTKSKQQTFSQSLNNKLPSFESNCKRKHNRDEWLGPHMATVDKTHDNDVVKFVNAFKNNLCATFRRRACALSGFASKWQHFSRSKSTFPSNKQISAKEELRKLRAACLLGFLTTW